MKKIFYLFTAIIVTSCSSSKSMVNSLSKSKMKSNIYKYYEDDDKMSYQVFNDKDNLYVNLRTSDRMAVIKIIESGLSIYFDETGKKSKDVVVEYPLHNADLDFSQFRPKNSTNGRSDFDVNQLLNNISNYAIFKKGEDIEQFNLELNSTNISIELKAIKTEFEDDLLEYKLKMPLSKITNKSISELDNFSIGIVSGKIKTPQRPQSTGTGRPSGGGRPAGVGGGKPSGSGGGRPSGAGRPSGGGKPSNISSEITTPITIWFDLKFE
jgi:hypothetical protein